MEKETKRPDWLPDDYSEVCMRCDSLFSFTNRRHHCRVCGYLVCNACSKQKV